MSDTDIQFVGGIPENYETGLGPHIFEGHADRLAARTVSLAPARILELAGGTGILSRRIAAGLAAGQSLTITDLNKPMLDVAEAKLEGAAPRERITFAKADAQALPFEDASFDLILCQFGVMFFPDKVASFREAARVLAPGGTYLFNCWGTNAENPFSEVAHSVAARFFPDNPPGFYRAPFSYPDPAIVRADLAAGGFGEIEHRAAPLTRRVSDAGLFARGLVFGNPLVIEIEERGGTSPQDVHAAMSVALTDRFGPAPFEMPLLATEYEARIG